MGSFGIVTPAPAGIDAPSGIQFVPASTGGGSGEFSFITFLFKDTTGNPDRVVLMSRLNANTIRILEYKRLGQTWVFDAATCSYDLSITLNFTAASQTQISVFAIDDPAGTGDKVVFVAGNNDDTTDTFEIDSIVLPAIGGTTLTATAVVIAGVNQPTDTNNMATQSIPLSTTKVMTFFQDDAHFADVTESGGTYTFTYADSKVEAIDTTIDAGPVYSGVRIGDQVLLGKFNEDSTSTSGNIWEMSTAGVLTEEFVNFLVGFAGSAQEGGGTALNPAGLTGIGGQFALATPVGGVGVSGGADVAAYMVTTFPLDDI